MGEVWRRVYTLVELIAVPTRKGEVGSVPEGTEIELPEREAERLARREAVLLLEDDDGETDT